MCSWCLFPRVRASTSIIHCGITLTVLFCLKCQLSCESKVFSCGIMANRFEFKTVWVFAVSRVLGPIGFIGWFISDLVDKRCLKQLPHENQVPCESNLHHWESNGKFADPHWIKSTISAGCLLALQKNFSVGIPVFLQFERRTWFRTAASFTLTSWYGNNADRKDNLVSPDSKKR